MRIYKTKIFRRWSRKQGMSDASLSEAIARAERGLIDAKLGHHLIKQRVGREASGRRGGFRTVIAYRIGDRAVFLYGFAKNDQVNLSAADERDMAETGALLLGLSLRALETMMEGNELWEVEYHGEDQN